MGQWPSDGLFDDIPLLRKGPDSLPNIHLKFSIVDINILISVFFQPLRFLHSQLLDKGLRLHYKHNNPSLGNILRFQFVIGGDLLITKKLESFENVLFVIGIVDCSNLPFAVG